MSWHRITASTDPASDGSERLFDWLLRGLTIMVILTLVACVAFLAWRWLGRKDTDNSLIPVTEIDRPVPPLTSESTDQSSGDEVLVKPDQMYRCEGQGQVSFSDRPCTEGRARVMELPEKK